MNDTEHLPLGTSESENTLASAANNEANSLDPKRMIIAERLRAARIAAHLTQQQLAEGLYSKSYLSAIERGKMTPSLQALTRLAERLALPVSYFLGETEINLEVLEESSALLNLPADPIHIADEAAAALRLGEAEKLIRHDQPHEALEVLGGSDEPPQSFPPTQLPQWYWLAGWALGLENKNADAIRLLEHGFHLAESLHLRGPRAERARLAEQVERLRCYLGIAYCANGQTDLALHYHLQGQEAIDKNIVTDADLKLMIYKGLGLEHLRLGRYEEAITFYKLALKYGQDQVDKRQYGLAAQGLGMAYERRGDLQPAKESYQEALEVLGLHGNRRTLIRIRAALGQVLANLKEHADAEHHLQRSLAGARQLNDSRLIGAALGILADLYLARSMPDQAIHVTQEALQLAQQNRDQRIAGQLHYTLAAAYVAMQNSKAAERAFKEAIRIAEQISDRDMLSQAQQRYADFLAEHKRFQEAFALMQRTHSSLPGEQKGSEHSIAQEIWTTGPTNN